MAKWSSEREDRQEILNLVVSHYYAYKGNKQPFQPGDRIGYAGQILKNTIRLNDEMPEVTARRIIRALNEAGYRNIVAYDPVAMEEFQAHCQCADTYDKLLEQAGTVAITTAWPMFQDVTTRTNAPVVDCRFML